MFLAGMNDWPPETYRTLAALVVLLLLLTWESIAPFFLQFARARADRTRHALRNLALGGLNALLNGVICVGLWWAVAHWAADHGFGLLRWFTLPAWPHWLSAFILLDLWMYGWHRLNHRMAFLWRFHRVHHSDPAMDVTTASRFHAGEIALSCVMRLPIIALLGIGLLELVVYESVMFAVVQLHHANVKLPDHLERALRVFIVTPNMHKVHHSNWQPETDSNYSSLFSFWDRLFRTFRLRADPRSLQFGLHELARPEDQTLKGLLTTPFKSIPRHRSPRPH
jgi:sterol desaturase/sphingolipid hydroxylase (fatty acid hydroxylase superfamily)